MSLQFQGYPYFSILSTLRSSTDRRDGYLCISEVEAVTSCIIETEVKLLTSLTGRRTRINEGNSEDDQGSDELLGEETRGYRETCLE